MRKCKNCPGPKAQEVHNPNKEKESQKVTTLFKKKPASGKKTKL